MEKLEQERNDVESEKIADAPGMRSYFISSDIPEELVLMPLLAHSALFACL